VAAGGWVVAWGAWVDGVMVAGVVAGDVAVLPGSVVAGAVVAGDVPAGDVAVWPVVACVVEALWVGAWVKTRPRMPAPTADTAPKAPVERITRRRAASRRRCRVARSDSWERGDSRGVMIERYGLGLKIR
jgi:hypothetical protein